MVVKNNFGSSQNCDMDFVYCFYNVEDEFKDKDNCVFIDYDMNDVFDEYD